MEKEEFKKRIENQYILLDSNILLKAFNNSKDFEDIFKFLKDANCDIVNFDIVYFEFSRNTRSPRIRKLKDEFIEKMDPTNLPYRQDMKTVKDALEIAQIYAFQNTTGVSTVDCCIASLLKHFSHSLFLLTLNHKDFPAILFDRVFVFPVETKNNIFTTAFYKFDQVRFDKLKIRFEKNIY